MTTLTTHVLDTARGVPAAGITIRFYCIDGDERTFLTTAVTNDDGRTDAPLGTDLSPGVYEVVFETESYFRRAGQPAFYGDIPVRFTLAPGPSRHHVPLLLSPFGYATYRGS